MYLSHFGLTEAPFAITPNPRYLYLSRQHREGLAHLLFGIGQPGGFVQLTGEVGTGKTILCRCLLEQLPPEVDVALILNPRQTAAELLASICDELRVPYAAGNRSLKELVDGLYRHLLEAHGRGRRTVLIIDEAQNLTAGVLEQIRLLTNLETSTEKLLQIILIGQPELLRLLEQRQLRQLAQRITARCHLLPFSRPETRAYVEHRLRVAGGTPALFTPAALRAIHRLSGGVPRLINVLCDRALLGAYASGASRVDARTLRRAGRELRGALRRSWLGLRPAWTAAALLLALAGAAGSVLLATGRLAGWSDLVGGGAPVVAASPRPALPDARLAAVEGMAVRPATAEGPAPSRLAELLAGPGDARAAVGQVYARWGLPYQPAKGGGPCDVAGPHRLECSPRTGNWTRLRRLDLPVVLDLAGPAGERRAVALIGLGETDATLWLDGRPVRVPLAEVERAWDGAFTLLWRAPALGARLLGPGMEGKGVLWVRRALDQAEGAPASGEGRPLYDEALQQRVAAFQRSHALAADGIVGEETLVQLALVHRGPEVPSLRQEP
ncbi:MAG: AAA family ATPase [Candidatus Methylomirabilales bacterium]